MINKKIKKLRIENNLSLYDVAKELGIPTYQYAFFEAGRREPSLDNLKKLSLLFDVTCDYLIGIDDDIREIYKIRKE